MRAWEARQHSSPFLMIETPQGQVGVTALGEDRYRLTGPGHESEIVGFDAARDAAHAVAEGRAP